MRKKPSVDYLGLLVKKAALLLAAKVGDRARKITNESNDS